jgi:hypothetical protein
MLFRPFALPQADREGCMRIRDIRSRFHRETRWPIGAGMTTAQEIKPGQKSGSLFLGRQSSRIKQRGPEQLDPVSRKGGGVRARAAQTRHNALASRRHRARRRPLTMAKSKKGKKKTVRRAAFPHAPVLMHARR